MATWPPTPRWCWPNPPGPEAPRHRRGAAPRLAADPRIASAEVAGPASSTCGWRRRLGERARAALTRPLPTAAPTWGGAWVNVEYVSANPTGPLHVGHTRGAVVGDALAALLEFAGYDVTREYYINDGGAQVDVLARSVYLRYLEAHGHRSPSPTAPIPATTSSPVGEALKDTHGDAYVGQPEASGWTRCATSPPMR